MGNRPTAFGIQPGIEVRVSLIQQLGGTKTIKPQQPVRLIEPMLPQQRRLGIQRGQEIVFYYRHIGRIKHSFEPVLLIKSLRQMQNVPVGVLCRSHDQLGTLSRRSKGRGMLIFDQFLTVFQYPVADQPHRPQDSFPCFVGSKQL